MTAEDITNQATIYDGVICFGGVDWWYHNRGHYDPQIMRHLSRHIPVVYVNSVGMRAPRVREGSMFMRRVMRKLGSLRRGLRKVDENFYIYSARTPPGPALTSSFWARGLAAQVGRVARAAGMKNPLVWVACPPAAHVLDTVRYAGLVYQRTDRMEEFSGVERDYIRGLDQSLKARSDLTFFCSSELYESERSECRNVAFVDHGVDFECFAAAAESLDRGAEEPEDIRRIQRPRIGFVGGVDEHTFNADFFTEVAAKLPDCQFVLVGACSMTPSWSQQGNVHQLGQRPYEAVPAYMAACDVLIMPWNQNEWIRACNPVKLKEYLATGRPVVSTPFPELTAYGDHVTAANAPTDFADAIRSALTEPGDPQERRERVRSHTWQQKAMDTMRALEDVGLCAGSQRSE